MERELDALLLQLTDELEAERSAGGPPSGAPGGEAPSGPAAPGPEAIPEPLLFSLETVEVEVRFEPVDPDSPRAAEPAAATAASSYGAHLDDATLDALRAGILGRGAERAARGHVAACLACLRAGAARWSRDAAARRAMRSPAPASRDEADSLELAFRSLARQLSSLLGGLRSRFRESVASDPVWRWAWRSEEPAVHARMAGPSPAPRPAEVRARAAARRRVLRKLWLDPTRRSPALDQARKLDASTQAFLERLEGVTLAPDLRERWEGTLDARWEQAMALLAAAPRRPWPEEPR
jgi:hypothetical protein